MTMQHSRNIKLLIMTLLFETFSTNMNTSSPPSQLLVYLSILHILSSPVNALSIKILTLQLIKHFICDMYDIKIINFKILIKFSKKDFYHDKL